MVELGLSCCAGVSLVVGSAVPGLLIGRLLLLWSTGSKVQASVVWHVDSVLLAPGLQRMGSIVVAHRLRCPVACGIFPDQGSNLCLLHWQEDSLLLSHQGSSCHLGGGGAVGMLYVISQGSGRESVS